ncbi:hypothetical protein PIB30_052911 [Stylosanthes scabra]|uniref:Uncharacterized protein n=1 Tax=Stylosanthes scabra TaxID=79078 RepID=A0ABU6UKL3_9FABA|nr:hypothetical protein [Stylosanthes scabra]
MAVSMRQLSVFFVGVVASVRLATCRGGVTQNDTVSREQVAALGLGVIKIRIGPQPDPGPR